MKIVHITTAHPVGDTRILHRECATLAAHYSEVLLVAPAEADQVQLGVKVRALPLKRGRSHRVLRAIPRALSLAIRERPALYHLHDPELIPVGVVLRLLGHPVVLDVHEHFSQIAHANAPRGLKAVARLTVRLAIEVMPKWVFTRLVYPTEALRHSTVGNHPKAVVVRNLPSRRDVADGGPADASFDAVFLGTISPFRMRALVDACERVASHRPETRWLFVGIPPRTIDWVRAEYAGSDVLQRLELCGRVEHSEVMSVLQSARLGINFHPDEERFRVAIPNKVLEYMAVGLPTVTTAFPELSALLTDDELRQIPPGDAQALADAIIDLLNNQEAALRLGRRGQEAIRERVNWEALEEPTLVNMYDEIIARKA